ncbi:MAG: hypothetical protein LKJ48_11385 [Lactobacillus sp.]|jgi:hypothetical protein|nr:hypothetical protein [Lactobacillus sp.]
MAEDTVNRTARLSFYGTDSGRYNFNINQLRNDADPDKTNAALDNLANLSAFQRGEVQLYSQPIEASQITTIAHLIVER